MKSTTQQHLKWKWAGPIDKNGKFQLFQTIVTHKDNQGR